MNKIYKYTITVYTPEALSGRDREYLESHIDTFLAAGEGGESNVKAEPEEVDAEDLGLERLVHVKCAGCGCELEHPCNATVYPGSCSFEHGDPEEIPVGSYLCDYCTDHYTRGTT